MIELIPAIDIIDGKCVRLSQGDYERMTTYNHDPLEVAKEFQDHGIRRLHVVDLDGAKAHHVVNYKALERIASRTSLIIDFGGGIKSDGDLEIAFESGAQMVTGGSIAVKNPEIFLSWLEKFGSEKIILGADAKNGKIAVGGWTESSDKELIPFVETYVESGVKKVITTDICKDGMLNGPSIDLYKKMMSVIPEIYLIASGGVASITFFVKINMLAKRIIPCLDVKDGKTVKGVNFVNFRDAGDPVELGHAYSRQGADELVYLDITASYEGRKTFTDIVKKVAAKVSIPFTVGGGINEMKDVDRLLSAGADKVSINSSALKNPRLIEEIAKNFGSQVCVVAIDANFDNDLWRCYLNGGRVPTDRELFSWAREAQERGAGEILFTSMTHDGVKEGYANDALATLNSDLSIPVIASGGAGKKEHFKDVFQIGKADAALAASVFHFGEISISELKDYLDRENICVRK